MLFDVEMNSISSRQLGQHSAHRMWSAIMQELSAMPDVEVTLQQVGMHIRLYGQSQLRTLKHRGLELHACGCF